MKGWSHMILRWKNMVSQMNNLQCSHKTNFNNIFLYLYQIWLIISLISAPWLVVLPKFEVILTAPKTVSVGELMAVEVCGKWVPSLIYCNTIQDIVFFHSSFPCTFFTDTLTGSLYLVNHGWKRVVILHTTLTDMTNTVQYVWMKPLRFVYSSAVQQLSWDIYTSSPLSLLGIMFVFIHFH